jgi:hypothetical protein
MVKKRNEIRTFLRELGEPNVNSLMVEKDAEMYDVKLGEGMRHGLWGDGRPCRHAAICCEPSIIMYIEALFALWLKLESTARHIFKKQQNVHPCSFELI